MDGAREGVTIRRVSVWFSSSLSTWVPVNPPLIPRLPAGCTGSFWMASCINGEELSPRCLLVKADWRLRACGENTALHLISKSLSTPFSPLSLLFLFTLFIFLISTPLLFNVINFHLSLHFCPYSVLPFLTAEWQERWRGGREREGERERQKNLPLLSGARMMSWGHLSSWCGGFPSPANYLVQTRIWYGGYEAQTQLLWANKEILRFREWARDCKWDRRKGTRTAMHARTHAATACTHTRSHTHPQTQPLVLPLHSLR